MGWVNSFVSIIWLAGFKRKKIDLASCQLFLSLCQGSMGCMIPGFVWVSAGFGSGSGSSIEFFQFDPCNPQMDLAVDEHFGLQAPFAMK